VGVFNAFLIRGRSGRTSARKGKEEGFGGDVTRARRRRCRAAFV
jgi:hypothetical protein